jgi:hypothetical protein
MPIEIKEPIVVPEKTFKDWGIRSVSIEAPNPHVYPPVVSVGYTLHPVNETETLTSIVRNRHFPSLMEKALQDPSGKIMAAYRAVIAAVAVLEGMVDSE